MEIKLTGHLSNHLSLNYLPSTSHSKTNELAFQV